MNKQELFFIFSFIAFVAFVGFDIQRGKTMNVKAKEVVEVKEATPSVTNVVVGEVEYVEPELTFENYVREKFGEHADKAFLLLEGNEVCGGENKTHNPNAINDNTVWGGVGVDRGYWQINNVYHPHVSDWCASDIKCSTDYIFRMWVNDGGSFSKRWTTGKCLKSHNYEI
jgi:hypothetical protein